MANGKNHKKWDKSKHFNVATVYVGESIDLKKVQEGIRHYTFLTRDFPLVIKLLDHQYAVLTKFGTVSFWNVADNLRRQFLDEIRPFVKSLKPAYPYDDTLEVFIGAENDRFTFEEVYLRDIDSQKIQIISYVSSQSVALERYEDEIEGRLTGLGLVIETLKTGKWARLSQKSILQQIGNVLAVKQTAIAHLSLFDKPELTWERPELEQLYARMIVEYEIQDRFDVLNEKIDFLTENNNTLLEFVSGQREQRLEWIIIIIIAFETALVLLDVFKVF